MKSPVKLSSLAVSIVAVVAAVCLAACGSSGSAGSSGSSGSSKSTFTIGVVGSFSGVLASSFGGIEPTIVAWEKWTNAHGGVDGHPVKIVLDDDAAAASTSITDVRQLVGQDHVPVLVDASGVDSTWVPYIDSAKEPVITINGNILSPEYFTDGPALMTYQALGSFAVAKAEGGKKLAFLYCADVAACTQQVASAKTLASDAGLNLVYSSAAAANAPTYAPICAAAKAAGADVLNVYGPVSLQVNVANACVQEGDKFIVISSSLNFTNYWLKYPALNGAVEDDPDFPVAYDGNAAAQAFHQAMQQYEPSEVSNVNYGEGNAVTWVVMQEAAQALINSGVSKSATITPSDITNGLYKMDGNTLGGLAPPLKFSASDTGQGINCWYTMAIQNEKFVAPVGLKLSCYNKPLS
jgi:branched-chain amino acid transport system substrate-binding protein